MPPRPDAARRRARPSPGRRGPAPAARSVRASVEHPAAAPAWTRSRRGVGRAGRRAGEGRAAGLPAIGRGGTAVGPGDPRIPARCGAGPGEVQAGSARARRGTGPRATGHSVPAAAIGPGSALDRSHDPGRAADRPAAGGRWGGPAGSMVRDARATRIRRAAGPTGGWIAPDRRTHGRRIDRTPGRGPPAVRGLVRGRRHGGSGEDRRGRRESPGRDRGEAGHRHAGRRHAPHPHHATRPDRPAHRRGRELRTSAARRSASRTPAALPVPTTQPAGPSPFSGRSGAGSVVPRIPPGPNDRPTRPPAARDPASLGSSSGRPASADPASGISGAWG